MTSCATCARALQPAWKFCIYCGTATVAAELPVADIEIPDAEPDDELADEPESEQPLVEPVETPPADDDDDDGGYVDDATDVNESDEDPTDPDDEPEPDPVATAAYRSRPLPSPVNFDDGFDHFNAPPVAEHSDIDSDTDTDESANAHANESDDEDRDHNDTDADLAVAPIDPPVDDAPTTSIASLASVTTPFAAAPAAPATATAAAPAPARKSVLLLDPENESRSKPRRRDTADEYDVPEDRTGAINVLAIIALALGVLLSPLAALFGHFALNQLKTSGEKGVIPAWIAVVLGYVWLGAAIVLGITYLATNA